MHVCGMVTNHSLQNRKMINEKELPGKPRAVLQMYALLAMSGVLLFHGEGGVYVNSFKFEKGGVHQGANWY
jgi:hypothetical protein